MRTSKARIHRLAALLASSMVLACTDRLATTPRVMVPEPRHSLSPEERSSVHPGINVDALERLLGSVAPEERARILAYFHRDSHAAILGARDSLSNALVQEIWAPVRGRHGRGSELLAAAAARRVELALVPDLPEHGAGALVIREAGSGRDLIVLTEHSATPRQLLLATRTLWQDRWAAGVNPTTTRRRPVRIAPEPASAETAAPLPLEREFEAQIDALRRAPARSVEGFGRARTSELKTVLVP
jgi:hypothetical protein